MRSAVAVVACLIATALPASAGATEVVRAGSLRAVVQARPWSVRLVDARGRPVLRQSSLAPLYVRTAAGTAHATRARSLHRAPGGAVVAELETTGSALLDVRVAPAGEGVIRLVSRTAAPGVQASGIAFEAAHGERYLGFGERSNALDQRGREVENYVSDGPFRPEDRNYVKPTTPPWAVRDRDDATYFPVPWMLSSRGYGTLVDNDETSVFRLGMGDHRTWGLQVESSRLALRFFGGPTPAQALRRFTRSVGRQPPPPAPYAFGPWFQTGQKNKIPLAAEAAAVQKLRAGDAPVSVAETQMHFLPCGAHRGNEAYNRARTRFFHSQGLAQLVYFNPLLCTSYQPVYTQAAAAGVLQRAPGGAPFTYSGFVGGSEPAGFTVEPLSQFDFSARGARPFYAKLIREAFDEGHDGWMEDFGEYTPPQAVSADGTPGPAMHNRYPTDYHCAVYDIARRLPRPVVRFQRSGWTGSARCAYDVWGGDPTTVFGFDGLQSALRQGLTMGLSGVSRWGTDIGGYNSFGPGEKLTPELLKRWIEFGAVAGVMRTKASGIAVPSYTRPQIYDPPILPVWRRYAKLHTQLYPYLRAADAQYRRTGMPIMRQLVLAYPRDRRATVRDDEFLFGPDLLAAPVVAPGATRRSLYLPRGRWVDLWRSARFDRRSGGLALRRTRLIGGSRATSVPAPLDELPLLVRAGALLPMLSPDVDTLAPYGHRRGLVHLHDRLGEMQVLAFPRGRSRASFFDGERMVSVESRAGWRLGIRGKRTRAYRVQASMVTLARRFTPRRVEVNGRALPVRRWRYDRRTRVLRFTARGRVLHVSVR